MILAIYKKNKLKDKWSLISLAQDVQTAKKYSKKIKNRAIEMGFDDADSIIQSFDTVYDVPSIIEDPQPEKQLYN